MSSSRGAMLARSGVLQPAGRAAARRRGGRGSADESATAILAVRGFTQIVPWEASSRGPYGRGYADLLSKRQIVHKDLDVAPGRLQLYMQRLPRIGGGQRRNAAFSTASTDRIRGQRQLSAPAQVWTLRWGCAMR